MSTESEERDRADPGSTEVSSTDASAVNGVESNGTLRSASNSARRNPRDFNVGLSESTMDFLRKATFNPLAGLNVDGIRAALATTSLASTYADTLRLSNAGFIGAINPEVLNAFRGMPIDYGTLFGDNWRKVVANWSSLTRASDYAKPDPPASPYSAAMRSPASYFQADEIEIHDFDGLHAAITVLISKTPNLPLVWRGVRDADWGLHSQLFRKLLNENGVQPPGSRVRGDQPYPDEDQMVAAEARILHFARSDWRFDDMSALETFARIQHAGGPTRLIDVTKNPYIAAWFAVEADEPTEENDARLFAIATEPVSKPGAPSPPDSVLQLDEVGSLRIPFWHLLGDDAARQELDWGTGARRRVWVPPAYDPRISAQNAAFILDGVPITSTRTAAYFTSSHNVAWRRADLLASASIYAKMHKPTRRPRYNSRNFAPTFSFRISAVAKRQIREFMESRFGYTKSYIYPDVAALAEHLKVSTLSPDSP